MYVEAGLEMKAVAQRGALFLLLLVGWGLMTARAQEPPYFVTYSDALEEPDNLEIALKSLVGSPKGQNTFYSPTVELEYGATAWWTTEVYLQGQSTAGDSSLWTGWRWENRFRPIPRQLPVNPVFYLEYEDINGADKSLLEVVGNDGVEDLGGRNAENRTEVEHEVEMKLLLSSYVKSWNISENFIAEKQVNHGEPWEFGYALGVSRPLADHGGVKNCVFCRQNLAAGAEMYGGLGTLESFGLHNTSHYAGPALRLDLPSRGPSITFSPQFGLNDNSAGVLWRFKVSYEVQQVRELLASALSRGGR
jgi:hypothetical protein